MIGRRSGIALDAAVSAEGHAHRPARVHDDANRQYPDAGYSPDNSVVGRVAMSTT
jgi:hypothetical protein